MNIDRIGSLQPAQKQFIPTVINAQFLNLDTNESFNAGDFTITPRLGEFRVTEKRGGGPIIAGHYQVTLSQVRDGSHGIAGMEVSMPKNPGRDSTRGHGGRTRRGLPLKISVLHQDNIIDPKSAGKKTGERSFLNTLIACAEGEIENVSCMEIDQNPAAALSSVTYHARQGTDAQTIIPGFSEIVQSFQRNDFAEFRTPLFYTTSRDDIVAFELEFTSFKGMFRKNYHGTHYHPYFADGTIEYKKEGDLAFQSDNFHFHVSKQSLVRFHWRKEGLDPGRYTIKITKEDPADHDTNLKKSQIHLTRVGEITEDGLCYPGTALVAFRAMATEDIQGATPNINFVVRGKKVIDFRDFKPRTERWSNNPAWIIADLFLNDRYGLGSVIKEVDLDISTFKTAAAYYDELIPDRDGNLEKRYICDIVLDRLYKPLDVIQSVLVCARSYLTWVNGKVKLRPDRDEAATQSFDEDSIVKDSFYFSYIPLHARANFINVQFRNRAKNWDRDGVHVETPQASDGRVARVEKTAQLPGVTRETHALRLAKYYLLSGQRISVTCELRVAALGLAAEPGDVIEVTHSIARWTKKKVRILTIEESDSFEVKLNCVEHVPELYEEGFEGIATAQAVPNVLADPFAQPPPVVNFTGTTIFKVQSAPQPHIVLSYEPPNINNPGADWDFVRFYWADASGAVAEYIGQDKLGSFEWGPVASNQGFIIYASSVNKYGVETPLEFSPRIGIFMDRQTNTPRDVPKMWVSRMDKSLVITWEPPPDAPPGLAQTTEGLFDEEEERVDVTFGDLTPIDYYQVREGVNWESGLIVAERVRSTSIVIPVPAIGRQLNYHVKARSFEGVFSINEASYPIFVAKIPGRQVVQTHNLIDPVSSIPAASLPTVSFAPDPKAKYRYALFENPSSPPVVRTAFEVTNPATAFTVTTIEPKRKWDDGSLWDQGVWDTPHNGEGAYSVATIKFACPDDPLQECRTSNVELGMYLRKTLGVTQPRYDDPWMIYGLAGLTYNFEATEKVHFDVGINGATPTNITPGAEVRGCTYTIITTLISDWPIIAPEISTHELIFDLPLLQECGQFVMNVPGTHTVMITDDFTDIPNVTATAFSELGQPNFPIITSRSCNSFDVVLIDCNTCGPVAGTISYNICGV